MENDFDWKLIFSLEKREMTDRYVMCVYLEGNGFDIGGGEEKGARWSMGEKGEDMKGKDRGRIKRMWERRERMGRRKRVGRRERMETEGRGYGRKGRGWREKGEDVGRMERMRAKE
uniref:Uncharacterized protein n=1 Tax=Cacopsylla melanoneura TaxID=428564 RepID=A0A8D8ZEX3_9HEMI